MKKGLLLLLLFPILLYSQEVEYFYNLPIGKDMSEIKKELLKENFKINTYSNDSIEAVGKVGEFGICSLKLKPEIYNIISKENYAHIRGLLEKKYAKIDGGDNDNNQTMFLISKFRYLMVEDLKDSTGICLLDMSKKFAIQFKGITLGGTLKEILPRLLKDYQYLTQVNGTTTVLTGRFAGYNNCLIYVTGVNENDIVDNISVSLPSSEFWNLVYAQYKTLKTSLTEKYGEPIECVEHFEKTDDMISSLINGNTVCTTTFQPHGTAFGEIIIFLSGIQNPKSVSVIISYMDRLAQFIQNEKNKNDL